MEFDTEFELRYCALMGWKGVVQDRKLCDPQWVADQERAGNPLPQLMQSDFGDVELDDAVNSGKTGKAVGKDQVANEHMQNLDAVNREQHLFPALREVADNGEPDEWKDRLVSFLEKSSTTDGRKLEQCRGISLLSSVGKTFRQVPARRLRLVLRAVMEHTQGATQREGTLHNVLTLTQKIGERLEAGLATYACFIDLRKAFDTVKRRLLWSRARSKGIGGRLLQVLMEGYEGRRAAGKISAAGASWTSQARPDDGLGVTQGGVDSSDLFMLIIDSLDEEIRSSVDGTWIGIPIDGVAGGDVERMAVLKHADDTVLLAETPEALQMAVRAFQQWCCRWQVIPNPTKCDVVVFERDGCSKPQIRLAGNVLGVVPQVVYLGFVVHRRGKWTAHTQRRMKKAEKWDCVARRLVGSTGGCRVVDACQVREATAEVSTLYGAEMWAGADAEVNTTINRHQAQVARALLGMRDSAEACGVLTEVGWSSLSFIARKRRYMLWWNLGRTRSRLLRAIEVQAVATLGRETCALQGQSNYNWWRHTLKEIGWLERATGLTRTQMRAYTKYKFRRVVGEVLWRQEWEERVAVMEKSSRLWRRAQELRRRAEMAPRSHACCTRWPRAEYIKAIGGQYHIRLIAMARLDLLPVESEVGRWRGIPADRRVCNSCALSIGDVGHFVRECAALPGTFATPVGEFDGYDSWHFLQDAQHTPTEGWRSVARRLERRWRHKSQVGTTCDAWSRGVGGVCRGDSRSSSVSNAREL